MCRADRRVIERRRRLERHGRQRAASSLHVDVARDVAVEPILVQHDNVQGTAKAVQVEIGHVAAKLVLGHAAVHRRVHDRAIGQ